METDTLALFVDVASRESFVGAAEARGVSPSSVSRRIAQLEEEVGARLLERSTRRVAVTEAGSRFLDRARGILEQLDEAAEAARVGLATPTGTLRLTASTAFGERVLAPRMPAFQEAYPELALELNWTDANLDLVGEGLDLAVRLAPRITGDVVATELLRTRYRVCAHPDFLESVHARFRAPVDLVDVACVLHDLPGFDRLWRFRKRGARGAARTIEVPVEGRVRSSSALTARSLALAGVGPALLADWLVRDDLEAGRLVDLFPDHDVAATSFETAAWLVYPSRSFLPAKTRVMIDFLKGVL